MEFAYTTGNDGHGRVSVNRLLDERGCSALLQRTKSENPLAQKWLRRHSVPTGNVGIEPLVMSIRRDGHRD